MGGAAGPGKTDILVMEATRYVSVSDYKALILRRSFPQLEEIIDRARKYYPAIQGEYRAGNHTWYFPSGAQIKFGHIQNPGDEYNYQGKEYQYIAFDEAGQFLPTMLLYLFSRCRSTNPDIPKRIRYATNPGGPSHQFLKDRFRIGQYPQGHKTFSEEIDIVLPGSNVRVQERIYRVFIPGLLKDNKYIYENDPGYVAKLMQLPEIERMRLLEGRWDAFEGQFFPELNQELHGFSGELPFDWECYGSFDWGYARPWVYLLIRVDYDGNLWLDHCHYGAKEDNQVIGSKNVGLRMTDIEIARKIREIELELNVPKPRFRVAGADIWSPKKNREGMLGPSPAEEMAREGITFIKADNNRIQGWSQIHHRLGLDDEGRPSLYIRKDLYDVWRTMQGLQSDANNPEDIPNKDIEDHIPEAIRYGCMARPMKPRVSKVADIGSFQYERRRYLKARAYAARKGTSIQDAYGRI